jgi:hypothetical protein
MASLHGSSHMWHSLVCSYYLFKGSIFKRDIMVMIKRPPWKG